MNDIAELEKHTIVLRVALSIYRMDRAQLLDLYRCLQQSPDAQNPEVHAGNPRAGDADVSDAMMTARIFVQIRQLDKDALLTRLRTLKDPAMRWVRDYPRLPCALLVDFALNGRAYLGCIRDISAGGVYIETTASLKPGQELALCFTLAERNEYLPFKTRGRVIRAYPDGVGVRYEQMTIYQRDIINTLIKRKSL
jgi:hypothetical protein